MLPGVFFSFSALGLSMRGTDSKNLLWETETTLRAFRLKGDNSDRAYFFSSIGSSVHTLAIKMASCIKKKKKQAQAIPEATRCSLHQQSSGKVQFLGPVTRLQPGSTISHQESQPRLGSGSNGPGPDILISLQAIQPTEISVVA